MSGNTIKITSLAFSRNIFKNFPELKPLISFLGLAMSMCTSYMAYALITKPDVRINKRNDIPPWEQVQPLESKKFVQMNTIKENSELKKLREEIGAYTFK